MSTRGAGMVSAAALAATALILTAAPGAAQTATIEACYVPGSGTVYVVNAQGAPDGCRSPRHVQFTWASTFPSGRCAPGQFMVGIGQDGALLCEALPQTDDPGSPGGFPTGHEGVYTLEPTLQTVCTGSVGTVPYAEAFIVAGTEPGLVGLDLIDENGQPTLWRQILGVEATYDAGTGTFSVHREVQGGTLSYSGSFPGEGLLELEVDMEVTFSGQTCTTSGSTTGTFARTSP